jgi:PAS domain-containing protein
MSFWDQAPIGFAVVNEQLRFVRVNERLARLLRRTREEVVGKCD